ncbi:hypothetical protein ACI2L1_00100 [Streptomyces sp. NPDC019531]|uniref:hypothetical protein n=1 Tax=Streptomyces sp. NPDC019531 TaxID=3365062 RepID=UPI00384C53BE
MARGLVAEAVDAPPGAIVLDMMVPELAPTLGSIAEARPRRAAALAAEQQAITVAVHELVANLRLSQGDAGRLLGMSASAVAPFTPPRGSVTTAKVASRDGVWGCGVRDSAIAAMSIAVRTELSGPGSLSRWGDGACGRQRY